VGKGTAPELVNKDVNGRKDCNDVNWRHVRGLANLFIVARELIQRLSI
jgi:hypothetical protein